jgi:hypothetical protein
MPAERLQQVIQRHLGDIDGEIEVAMDPGLAPNKCVDTPSAGNPNTVIPCAVSDTQRSADIGSGHVPASVVTDVRHHEASQAGARLSGTGWPTAQRSCPSPTADRDAFQRYVCHTWKRNELPNTGDRRGSGAQRRGEGDAQPAVGDSRPV